MLSWMLCVALAHETPEAVRAWRDQVDWQAVAGETSGWLSEYLAIDTVNPPGNEAAGAAFLERVLRAEGIDDVHLVDHGDHRASLWARLPGDGSEAPLCLASHLDVVPSELEHWTVPPLSGEIRDGYVWGRGALDMKGMGIVQLAAMVQLKRLGVPLTRDVILLAVADEEADGMGMKTVLADHWSQIGCSHMINEGGLGVRDALFEGQTLHAVSVAEKGTLWVRMIASGVAGHGSTIDEGEAPARLLEAMARVEKRYRSKPEIDSALYELFHAVGVQKGGVVGALIKSRSGVRTLVKPQLMKNSATRAVLTNTVHLTGMGGASSVNVVPSEVWAQYDCRLLPGTPAGEQLARLRALTDDMEGIRWEVLHTEPGNRSPVDDPFYKRIVHYAAEDRPDAAAGPVLSVGFTDSIYARRVGVHAYGYVPFVVTEEEARTMHGHDERVSVENLAEGTRRMFSLVADFAGVP